MYFGAGELPLCEEFMTTFCELSVLLPKLKFAYVECSTDVDLAKRFDVNVITSSGAVNPHVLPSVLVISHNLEVLQRLSPPQLTGRSAAPRKGSAPPTKLHACFQREAVRTYLRLDELR